MATLILLIVVILAVVSVIVIACLQKRRWSPTPGHKQDRSFERQRAFCSAQAMTGRLKADRAIFKQCMIAGGYTQENINDPKVVERFLRDAEDHSALTSTTKHDSYRP